MARPDLIAAILRVERGARNLLTNNTAEAEHWLEDALAELDRVRRAPAADVDACECGPDGHECARSIRVGPVAMATKTPAAVSLGRLGGSKSSAAKAAAARKNGKRGGRPPKKKPKPV